MIFHEDGSPGGPHAGLGSSYGFHEKPAGEVSSLLTSGAESAREIDNQADQQNEPDSTATDGGTPKVKSTAAKQEQKNN